jgi:SAM-dependent methyltransferase
VGHYKSIVSFYEGCFEQYGDGPNGHHWPNLEDLEKRYNTMLSVIKDPNQKNTLLDFGCGSAMLYGHILENFPDAKIEYSGLDLSPKFIEAAKVKFPKINFLCFDVLQTPKDLQNFDYIVMNGVFTERINLTFDEMWDYFKKMIRTVFIKANKGIAFNVMSKQVDWEKDFLFHLPLDMLAFFLSKELTRNYVIRNDYGLYEYTTYVYK